MRVAGDRCHPDKWWKMTTSSYLIFISFRNTSPSNINLKRHVQSHNMENRPIWFLTYNILFLVCIKQKMKVNSFQKFFVFLIKTKVVNFKFHDWILKWKQKSHCFFQYPLIISWMENQNTKTHTNKAGPLIDTKLSPMTKWAWSLTSKYPPCLR